MCGRSNVGKSSLINCLCRRRALAKTSSVPGKTRLINVFLIDGAFHLIDLPGYGYAKVSRQEQRSWGKMMDDYFSQAGELRLALHLVDIRHEPGGQDREMNAFLYQTEAPFLVVAQGGQAFPRAAPAADHTHRPGAGGSAWRSSFSSQTGEGRRR